MLGSDVRPPDARRPAVDASSEVAWVDGLHQLAHHRAGRAAAARSDDELSREQFDRGPQRRVGDALDQLFAGALADAADRLPNRGQGRVTQGCRIYVIETDKSDI